jgi:hypothetical protein
MASEETPLLADAIVAESSIAGEHSDSKAVYDRFTPARKRVILALVSICGLIPRASCVNAVETAILIYVRREVFISGSFMPVIPDIAKDLDATAASIRSVGSTLVLLHDLVSL